MDFEDNFLLDSDLFTQSMVKSSNIHSNYGPALTKYDYFEQTTSLGSASASSSYSSGSSASSSSGSNARNESFTMLPTTSPPMIKEEDYDDDGLNMLMELPPPPHQAKPPAYNKTGGVKKSNQGGRKRSIIFEQEEAEMQRKEFLERNRIAASKCRQKKKRWMQGLEANYEKLSTQNQRLRSMVMMFQDEVNSLKTELLARNGLCSCTDMRTYFQQNNNNTTSTMDPRNSITQSRYVSTSQSMSMPPTSLPSVSPPEPNAFLPNNTLPPLSLSLPPYLNE